MGQASRLNWRITYLIGINMDLPQRTQFGFTLVETMIATTIFSFVAIGVMSIFGQMLIIQRGGSMAQRVEENVQYVLERMAREIRISTIAPDQDADCAVTIGDSLNIGYPTDTGSITVVYSVTPEGVVQRTAEGTIESISSSDVVFTQFGFCISGSGDDGQQARVAIVAGVKDVRDVAGEKIFHLQTTVTPRRLDTY